MNFVSIQIRQPQPEKELGIIFNNNIPGSITFHKQPGLDVDDQLFRKKRHLSGRGTE